MSNVEKIIREVDSSMRMEGLPLSDEDKNRIKACLTDSKVADTILRELVGKYTLKPAVQTNVR